MAAKLKTWRRIGLMAVGESDHYEKTVRVDQGILLEMK